MKTILITGANRGLGLQASKDLAHLGHRVILTARNEASGQKEADSIQGTVRFHPLDVTNLQSIKTLRLFLESESGGLDVLINNAGISSGGSLIDGDMDTIRRIMDTNFYGPMMLNQALIPLLRKSSDARIINVSSGMGAMADLGTGYAGYRLSKAGLNAQTILLSNELHGSGIEVNAVSPGWVRTDMGGPSASRSVEKGAETIVWLATAENIPTGKFFRDKQVIDW